MKRSETYIVASIAAFSVALSAGCFSSSNGSSPPPDETEAGADATASSSGSGSGSSSGSSSSSSSGSSGGVDASEDASEDATIEAGPEAGVVDAGVDAAPEAGPAPEAGIVDAGVDAAPEAGSVLEAGVVEAGVDAAPEAGVVALDAGTVAISANTQAVALADTASLFIYDSHAVWSYGSATQVTYQNLPAALIGTVGNDTVNTTNPVTFTLKATTTCYLIRQDGWTAVDLTGWKQFATAPYYFSGYDNGSYGAATIYVQTFPAGVYNWNTYSAMYSCAE